MPGRDVAQTDLNRLWLIEHGAGPSRVSEYLARSRANVPNFSFGTPTPIFVPSPSAYGRFDIAEQIPGEESPPTMSTEGRYDQNSVSRFFDLARRQCSSDLLVLMGECQHPQDFATGWEKILFLQAGLPTQWSLDALGALEPGQRAPVNEPVDWQGADLYEIVPLGFSEQAAALVQLEVVGIVVCDSLTCGGACGNPTSGCDHVFAIALAGAASPGILAQVIYSGDGGTTWAETFPTTLGATEDPTGVACVQPNLVVISNDSNSLHYASIVDILNGVETWTEVTTGFVVTGEPNAIFSLHARRTWIVGDGGFVYFTADPTTGVTVQEDGTATTEDLADVHALDDDNALVCGANNAVLLTRNGGATWQVITGPAVGVALNTCWMAGEDVWFIGDAGGNLWYTLDAGVNWTQKPFSGDGAGQVRDIVFRTPAVGYMSHDTAAPLGRIFRTHDGGNSWQVMPRASLGSMPANDQFTQLATCEDVNKVYAGGLADDGSDGIIVKGEA